MSVPLGHVNGRNLVIASVGTSTEPASNYQELNTEPTERTNGGDLLPGDMWYNSSTSVLSIFTSVGWITVNDMGAEQERIQTLEDAVVLLTTRVEQLEQSSMATNYTIDNLSIRLVGVEASIQDHEQRLTNGGL